MDKEQNPKEEVVAPTIVTETTPTEPLVESPAEAPKKVVEVNKDELDKLIKTVEAQAEKLKMLEAVADKGRVFNYESKRSTKAPMKIKLSRHNDCFITGWRNAKDVGIYDPRTGAQTGETQQMEILLLDKEGKTKKEIINGYARFSDIKYADRVDCEVVNKTENWEGNWTFTVRLPGGQEVDLDQAFIN